VCHQLPQELGVILKGLNQLTRGLLLQGFPVHADKRVLGSDALDDVFVDSRSAS